MDGTASGRVSLKYAFQPGCKLKHRKLGDFCSGMVFGGVHQRRSCSATVAGSLCSEDIEESSSDIW